MSVKKIPIELLAPARNLSTAMAAIDCGADAVYIGGSKLGARKEASNATEDIRRAVEYAHRFGVRIYATLNTVVFENELEEARKLALELMDAGVDAFIVQDMSYLRMGLEGVEFHASTQMFNSSPEKARFLSDCGFSRIVLERNLSLDEIAEIRHACNAELECFVHGAVCVCYSGQCAMSLSMGMGSGNRGSCSQPCRLPYDLEDGRGRVWIKGKHLLSVCDLDLSEHVGEMMDAGVTSFKIEGRLKDENYVRNVTAYYRRVIDCAISCREGFVRSSYGETVLDFEPDLSKSFTRNGSSYFFDGIRKGVASFDTPKSIGEYAGTVVKVRSDCFELDKKFDFSAGDGICFMSVGHLCGTNINNVEAVSVYPNSMDGIVCGCKIYRNYDHKFNRMLERGNAVRKVGIKVDVSLHEGKMSMKAVDCRGICAESVISTGVDEARDYDKMLFNIKNAMVKSGGTMFRVDDVTIDHSGFLPFVPISAVNELRRTVFDRLERNIVSISYERNVFHENIGIEYPQKDLCMSDNVVNSLAESFYRDHGVERIDHGVDLYRKFTGVTVMRTRYCIRRELGNCLKERGTVREDLYLVHGKQRFRLDFDCVNCEMRVIKE